MSRIIILVFSILITCFANAQTASYDDLKNEIMNISSEVDEIDLRMQKSQRRFQSGILVSTLGYSVTIAGGLMLGRKNDNLGQTFLIAGGATGAIGTYFLFDAFNILAGRKKGRNKK
ncbi:MAG: hypothetical protein JXR03_09860 [Cyclobacteriaceae bacterium]